MPIATCLLGSLGIRDRITHGHDLDKFVELGSLTKVVTGTVLAQLVKAGTVNWGDPLDQWLGTVPKGTGITLRNLADHTSGLPRLPPGPDISIQDPYVSFTEPVLLRLLRNLDEVATGVPGRYEYSNLGYAVLGHALTTVTGRTFQQLADEHVLGPLGLEAGAMTAAPPAGHRLVPRRLGRPRALWTLTGPILPAGGLWSTPRTAARLLVGLVVERRLGEPAPSWSRASGSLWHNGATRDSSVFAGAHADGRWILLHRLHGDPHRTDSLALKAMKRSAERGGGAVPLS
ncbi:serine hydrolase domain-containing protein [Streptomyces pathocidini]|uniref:serine hydrolase domain-containing protein n=1 Tax=Streptomyces pathocidini TaxID=1650571 RepID=UPI0033DEEE5F